MRTWRVGSFSMGASLIMLGVMLIAFSLRRMETMDAFITWWPIVLVLVGLEIVVYIALSRKEDTVIRYDIFSILFIGLFVCLAAVMLMLTSTGLLGEVRAVVNTHEWTGQLPPTAQQLPPDVKRIVVNSAQPMRIDRSDSEQFHAFGTYRIVAAQQRREALIPKEGMVSTQQAGSTLYVTVAGWERKLGPADEHIHFDITMVVPERVQVELNGELIEPASKADRQAVDTQS